MTRDSVDYSSRCGPPEMLIMVAPIQGNSVPRSEVRRDEARVSQENDDSQARLQPSSTTTYTTSALPAEGKSFALDAVPTLTPRAQTATPDSTVTYSALTTTSCCVTVSQRPVVVSPRAWNHVVPTLWDD